MKRSRLVVILLLVAVSHAVVRADVTITMTNSIEGPMAALAGANAPSITMRIQGLKARTDIDVMGRVVATISDLDSKQMLMLDQTEKTVRRMPFASFNQPDAAGGLNVTMPKMDVTVERTGRAEQVAGQSCEEFHTVMIMSMDMSQVGGALPTPDARDAMKDVRMVMKGSTWISAFSPGASEIIRFQQAARAAGMAMPTNLFGGQNAPDPLAQAAAAGAEGLLCSSEIEMTYEGTGPMIEMLKKMGTMKVTTRLTAISLDPIPAEAFVVPAGYQDAPIQNPLIPRR